MCVSLAEAAASGGNARYRSRCTFWTSAATAKRIVFWQNLAVSHMSFQQTSFGYSGSRGAPVSGPVLTLLALSV